MERMKQANNTANVIDPIVIKLLRLFLQILRQASLKYIYLLLWLKALSY